MRSGFLFRIFSVRPIFAGAMPQSRHVQSALINSKDLRHYRCTGWRRGNGCCGNFSWKCFRTFCRVGRFLVFWHVSRLCFCSLPHVWDRDGDTHNSLHRSCLPTVAKVATFSGVITAWLKTRQQSFDFRPYDINNLLYTFWIGVNSVVLHILRHRSWCSFLS